MTRIPYRKPEPLPPWVIERKDEICGRRTPQQIRRCLKDWMLKTNREKQKYYFKRPFAWSSHPETRKNLEVYPYGPEETISYSNYFFPGRYSVLKRVLTDVKTMLPDFEPKRIVDFGCGPGTGAAVAVEVFGREAVSKYAGIDMSQSMQDAAAIMTRNLHIDCHFWSKTSDLIKRALSDDSERYDLAICSYTLTELANDPARRAAVQILFELLDCGGVVVFLEKGTPEGSHTVRTARQLLLDMCNPKSFLPHKKKTKKESLKDKGSEAQTESLTEKSQYVLRAPLGMSYLETDVRTIAPCTHDKPCPLANEYYCSFSQKVFGGLIRHQLSEKFSYVVMQKRKRTVFVNDVDADGETRKISFQAYSDKLKHGKANDSEFENVLHSRKSGGMWLKDSASEKNANDFPTPVSILKRFQSLGTSAQDLVDDSRIDDSDNGREEIDRFSRNQPHLPKDSDINIESAGLRRGRKPRSYLVRRHEEEEFEYDEEADDNNEVLQFQKPKTKADLLVDDLIDEIDWEEYEPPLYRHEWGRILR